MAVKKSAIERRLKNKKKALKEPPAGLKTIAFKKLSGESEPKFGQRNLKKFGK